MGSGQSVDQQKGSNSASNTPRQHRNASQGTSSNTSTAAPVSLSAGGSRPIATRRPGAHLGSGAAVFESPVVSPNSPSSQYLYSHTGHSSSLAGAVGGSNASRRQPVAVTFRWTLGGTSVFVTGSFVAWKSELKMQRDESDAGGAFVCTQLLEPGTHQYKFIVDGVWRHHPDQPTVHDEVGNINNFVDVVEPLAKQLFPRRPESPPGDYGQTVPDELLAPNAAQSVETNKAMRVPTIPPHLLRALLNTAPSPDDPSTLPLPHHVMVNHLYVLPRATHASDCTVLGATHMVRNKYVTTVFYLRANTASNNAATPTAAATSAVAALDGHSDNANASSHSQQPSQPQSQSQSQLTAAV